MACSDLGLLLIPISWTSLSVNVRLDREAWEGKLDYGGMVSSKTRVLRLIW